MSFSNRDDTARSEARQRDLVSGLEEKFDLTSAERGGVVKSKEPGDG